MFQPDPKRVSSPCAIELVQTQVARQEERKKSIADDLIGDGFTRTEAKVHRDIAVAATGSRWTPLDHAGTSELLTAYVPASAGPATRRGDRDDSTTTGSG
jgi:hypothetical protein